MNIRNAALAAGAGLVIIAAIAPAHAQRPAQRGQQREPAEAAPPARGPVPSWAVLSPLRDVPAEQDGAVFLRRQDVQVHLDDTGQHEFMAIRARIAHAAALSLGNIQIEWNPAAGRPVIHALAIHRGDQAIDVLDQATFEVLRREDQLEAAWLDGKLTATLRVPDLRVGDELELSYTTARNDPTMGADSAGLLFVAPTPPPGRLALGISWTAGQEPTIRAPQGLAEAATRTPQGWRIQLDDVAPQPPIADAPGRFQWRRVVEYSDFASWQDVSRKFAPLFTRASALPAGSAVKQEAARIAATHSDREAQMRAALELIQGQVRYIFVGLDAGNLTPATADETWQRRYGDCKGKTALLLALLAELAIPAEAVLVSNAGMDDGMSGRLPAPGLFDHVLVRATIGTETYWLDGTLPAVAGAATEPVIPYRAVLPLRAEGAGLELRTFATPALPQSITLHDIDASAGFDVPARVVRTTIVRGIEGLREHEALSSLPRAQLAEAFTQNAAAGGWVAVEDVRWTYDQTARASILKITGTQEIDWTASGDDRSISLPGGGFNPPGRRIRSAGEQAVVPFANNPEFSCDVTTVRLPLGTAETDWSHSGAFLQDYFGRMFYRAFEIRDGSARMIRGSWTTQAEITAAAAAADNARLGDFDNSMATIRYRPGRAAANRGNDTPIRVLVIRSGETRPFVAESVPAVAEQDWLAANVPCRPEI